MFRASTCPSSGGKIVFTQHLVSSLSVNVCTVRWLRADWMFRALTCPSSGGKITLHCSTLDCWCLDTVRCQWTGVWTLSAVSGLVSRHCPLSLDWCLDTVRCQCTGVSTPSAVTGLVSGHCPLPLDCWCLETLRCPVGLRRTLRRKKKIAWCWYHFRPPDRNLVSVSKSFVRFPWNSVHELWQSSNKRDFRENRFHWSHTSLGIN